MKLTPYKKILGMAKEKLQETLAPVRAMEMRKKAELEMCQIESKMIELDQKQQEACSEYPVNFDKLIKIIDEQGLLERRKNQYSQIIVQMFPD